LQAARPPASAVERALQTREEEGTSLTDTRTPAAATVSAEAIDFVRFCYSRRRVGWPELYDEMCAVASRGLYNGWGLSELSEHGIGFSLFETPALARVAADVAREESDRRATAISIPVVTH
jgi:hypothetical protein